MVMTAKEKYPFMSLAPLRSGSRLDLGLVLALLFSFFSFVLSAQSEDCKPSSNKKASKLYEQGITNPKLTDEERFDLFQKSVYADPNCVECHLAVGRMHYQFANERRMSPQPALEAFEKVIAICPTFHADAHYYAGLIHYTNEDYKEAVRRFEDFLLFDQSAGKVSRDHAEKEKDVARILPEIRFYVDFYENPVPYDPIRLENVNSQGDEYLPMLSPDNTLLFFTRKEKIKAKGDLYAREVETFMKAEKAGGNLDFGVPEPLPPPFNVGDNYGGVSLSLDNREMFVTVCKPVTSSYKNCDIYVTRFEREQSEDGRTVFIWSGLTNLGDAINTPEGWEAQPTISADGNTLYFATMREQTTPDRDGNPSIDIYYSTRDAQGQWATAKPIEGTINTAGNDKSPFIHADSRTMYFSSNGRPGAGGYDIYYSRQDENGKWATPRNLGYPINSTKDEHGLIVSTDGTTALFSSSNPEQSRSLDIYAFDLPRKARPEKVLILKGDVTNENGEPVTDARLELKYVDTKETREVAVDKADGHYAAVVNLRENEEVVVSVKSDTETLAFNSRVFTIADTLHTVQDLPLAMERLEPGRTYRMNDIRFATNSSRLDGASRKVLDEFADYLKENPKLRIEIGGHTDNVGDAYLNLVLSTDRAFEVFGYLQEMGVHHNRMSFKGYGDTVPVAPNDTPENRAKNRRTEFKILKQ